MKVRDITLLEWLRTIDELSDCKRIAVKFPFTEKRYFAGANEVRLRASPAMLEAPVISVWLGTGDDGIVITVKPPKEYNTRRP